MQPVYFSDKLKSKKVPKVGKFFVVLLMTWELA